MKGFILGAIGGVGGALLAQHFHLSPSTAKWILTCFGSGILGAVIAIVVINALSRAAMGRMFGW